MRLLRFISLWLTIALFFMVVNNTFSRYDILIQLINSFLFTTGSYLAYYVLIRRFLYQGHTLKFIASYLLLIAVLSTISMLSVYQVYVYQQNKFYVENYWKEPVFFSSNYILILLVTSTLLSFRILNDKRRTQQELELAEKEKVNNELNFLKAQINPHFLFNSLNNILFQIDKSNTTARTTLLQFADMLRYQLYDCNADLIPIEKELHYLQNYIDVQLLRKSDKYTCRLEVSDRVKDFSIPPLILIPFIENAFKHISNHPERPNTIRIQLDYQNGIFYFTCENDKDNFTALQVSEHKGIGLANVKRRLDLLYPGKHELEITNGEQQFRIHLQLQIN